MIAIGRRESVGNRCVSRMIRLAFLAPVIVERIAEGRQPSELTAQFLSTRGDLPLSWRAQHQLLGFADPTGNPLGQRNLVEFFGSFVFQVQHVTGPSCHRTSAALRSGRSPPPRPAVERKREKRARRPRESVSPVRLNNEYPRPLGVYRMY
jgi:hypothetical protein